MKQIPRRQFVKDTTIAGLGLLSFSPQLFASQKMSKVRLGMIAVGLRGQNHLQEMLRRPDVEVVAMADPDKKMMAMAQALVTKAGKKAAVEYTNGNYDYK